MSETSDGKNKIAWFFRLLFMLALVGTVLVTMVAGAVFWHFSRDLPKIITVADYRPLTVTRVLADGGKEDSVVGEFYKERRYIVPYEKIPEVVVRAFISAEDDRFFDHQGINFASIIRASIANFKAGHVVQGGSTITQQVAKSLLLTPERSIVRKIKEVILASRIEKNLSKQQILYLYLNQIYLGHGAYGAQAAALTYFRKDVSQITVPEAALLAGMPQAPGKYSPHLNPKRAKERQLYVLRRMVENGFISQAQMTEAAAQPLRIYNDEDTNKKHAAYYVEHVRRYLIEKYGEKAVYEDGLTVSIPASSVLSKTARTSLREGLRGVDKRQGFRGPVRKLKKAEEIETYLREQRLALIHRKIGYEMFLPDARMDAVDSIRDAGLASEQQLLDVGEIYPAVVTSVDDKRKLAGVMIGAVRADLPLEKMKWPKAFEPALPSRAVSKGDVVNVKVEQIAETGVTVALDQEPLVQGALVSIDSHTGYVIAMEGGYDYEHSEFNRATQAMRQPGSAFKPIIYAAALEKGFTPASVIVDSPLIYEDEESGKWKPTNFEEKFYGDTTFRQALIKSRNVPTIKIVEAIKYGFVIDYARRLGMAGAQFNADLSISLGSLTVPLLELTQVYAAFARLGRKVTPVFIVSVKDRDGRLLEERPPQPAPVPSVVPALIPQPAPSPEVSPSAAASATASVPTSGRPVMLLPEYPRPEDPEQVVDPRVSYVMTHLMKEVVTHGTGRDAKILGRVSAGKTGTTNDYIDAWFMGFTPRLVTGVWVGFDNQKAIGPGETGAKAALPIWLSYMIEATKSDPADEDFATPPGIVFASIDPVTGKLAPSHSSSAIREAFIEGTEPLESGGKNVPSAQSQSEFLKEDIE